MRERDEASCGSRWQGGDRSDAGLSWAREVKRRPMTIHDRKVIANGGAEGLSHAQIGKLIGRDKSLICRELQRHRARDGLVPPARSGIWWPRSPGPA